MKYLLLFAICTTFLTGCIEKKETTIKNIAPSMSIENAEVTEKASITLTLSVNDTDGSVANIEWQQISGTEAQVTFEANTFNITAPEASQNEELLFEVTATDDQGASTTSQFTLKVSAIISEITLSGMVGDETFVGKQYKVWTQIGTEQYSTVTNELGFYNLPISVDDSFVEKPIVLYASPDVDSSIVKLGSVLPSISDLSAKTDENKKVGSKDFSELNITPFTSASLAVVLADSETFPADFQAYRTAVEKVKLNELLNVTIVTSMILDNIEDNNQSGPILSSLPSDFSNTIDFLSNETAYQSMIRAYTFMNNGDTWVTQSLKLFSNSTVNIDSSDLQPEMFLSGTRLQFKADGNGQWMSHEKEDFTWELSDNIITVSFNESSLRYFGGHQYHYNLRLSQLKLTPVFRHNKELLFNFEPTYVNIDWGHLEVGAPYNRVLRPTSALISPLNAIEMGAEYILSYREPNDLKLPTKVESLGSYLNLKTVKFMADSDDENRGTAELSVSGYTVEKGFIEVEKAALWFIEDNQLILEYDGLNFKMAISSTDKEGFYISVYPNNALTNEKVQSRLPGSISPYLATQPLSTSDIENKIISTHAGGDGPYWHASWYEFNDDGTYTYVQTNDWNNDNEYQYEEDHTYIYHGLWKIEDGKLHMLRFRLNQLFTDAFECTSDNWTPSLDDECVVYSSHIWSKLKSTESNIFNIINQSRFYEDAVLRANNITDASPFSVAGVSNWQTEYYLLDKRPIAIPEEAFKQEQ